MALSFARQGTIPIVNSVPQDRLREPLLRGPGKKNNVKSIAYMISASYLDVYGTIDLYQYDTIYL